MSRGFSSLTAKYGWRHFKCPLSVDTNMQVRKKKSAKERRKRNDHLLSFARQLHVGE